MINHFKVEATIISRFKMEVRNQLSIKVRTIFNSEGKLKKNDNLWIRIKSI